MARTHLRILVLHGPNLNLLGTREPNIYGNETLAQINDSLHAHAKTLGAVLEIVQSNHEGEMVEAIHRARGRMNGIVINPAAYTHTSIAILDALLAVGVLAVEVHLSAIHSREAFRHHSRTAPGCVGMVAGFGKMSYILGLSGLCAQIRSAAKSTSKHL